MGLSNKKKRKYLKRKIKGTEYEIFNTEFLRFKLSEIREGVRQNYDNVKAQIQLHKEKYKEEQKKGNLSKDDLARIDDKRVVAEKERDRLQNELRRTDVAIHGSKRCNEFPDGHDGLDQDIDGYHELVGMLGDYLKRL